MSEFVLFTGPVFMGSIFNWGLLGILILQVYFYSNNFPRDRLWIKALVYGLFILDLLQTGFATHEAWTVLVADWGAPAKLAKLPWTSSMVPIMTGIISAIVQFFFAWRIFVLKRGNYLFTGLAILIVLLALMQSLSAVVNSIRFVVDSDVSELASLTSGVEVWLAGSFVCDILIAGCMLYILMEAKRSSTWKRTGGLVTKLIIHTVETGVVTTVTALVELILFLKFDSNFLHLAPAFLLGKMYSNVVLATLNGRMRDSSPNRRMMHDSQDAMESHQLSWNTAGTGTSTHDKSVLQSTTVVSIDDNGKQISSSNSNTKVPDF